MRRFPGHTLPKAWEDDVRANLSKHRQRVSLLREELDKEQFYVEYLESLLNDVERIKYLQKHSGHEGAEGLPSSSKNGHHKGGGVEDEAGPGESYVTIINVNNNESEKYGEIQKPLTSNRDNNFRGAYGPPPPKEPKDLKKLIDNPLYQDAQSLSVEVASRSSQSTTRETTPDDDSIIDAREIKPSATAATVPEKSHAKRGSLDSSATERNGSEASLSQERRHSESGPIVKDAHLKKKSSIDSTSSSSSSGSTPSVKPSSHSLASSNPPPKVVQSSFSQPPKPSARNNQTEITKPAPSKFVKSRVSETNNNEPASVANNNSNANNDSKRRPPTPPRKPKINELVMHFQRMGSSEPESHGPPAKPSGSKGISSPLIGPHEKKTKVQITSAKENGFSFNQENRSKNHCSTSELDAEGRRSQEPRSTTSTPNSLSSLPTTPDAEDVLNSIHGGRHLLLQKTKGAAKISDLSPQDANEETKSMASVTLTGATDEISTAETLKNDFSEMMDPDDDMDGDPDMEESFDSERFGNSVPKSRGKKESFGSQGASQDEIYDDNNIYDTVAPDEEDERHHEQQQARKQRQPAQHMPHHGSQRPAPYIGTPTSTIDDHEAMFLDSDSIHGADKSSSLSNLSITGKVGSHLQAGGHSYANYVNIDYFLRREETSSKDDSDDNESQTHFSQSISSDHDIDDVQGLPPYGLSKMGPCSSMPPQLPQPKLRRSRDQLKGSANDLASSQNRSASSTMSKGSGGRQREPIDSHATYDEVFEPQPYNPSMVTYDSVSDLQDEANSVVDGANDDKAPKEAPVRSTSLMNEAEEKVEAERIMMYRCIIASIVESETVYVDCLNTLLQYMKALKSTIGTTHPLLTADDLNTIFYKIPDLHAIHCQFLEGIRKLQDPSNRSATLPPSSDTTSNPISSYNTTSSDDAAMYENPQTLSDLFKVLASRLGAYSAYLKNYSKALETVHRCSAENNQFAEIARVSFITMTKRLENADLILKSIAYFSISTVDYVEIYE